MLIGTLMGLVIGLLLVIELGLQARRFLILKARPSYTLSPGQLQVLVIGDSVLGDEKNPTSLLSHLKVSFKKKSGRDFIFLNGAKPTNSSSEANYEFDSLVKEYKPQLTFILLGNSDYIGDKKPNSFFAIKNFLYKYAFRTLLFRLGVSLKSQAEIHLRKYFTSNNLNARQEQSQRLNFEPIPRFQKQDKDELNAKESNLEKLVTETLTADSPDQAATCFKIAKFAVHKSQVNSQITLDAIQKSLECVAKEPDQVIKAKIYSRISTAYKNLQMNAKAKLYYELALKENPENATALAAKGWDAMEANDCLGVIANFERLTFLYPPGRRLLLALNACYSKQKLYTQGFEFFQKLGGIDKKNNKLIERLALALKMQLDSTSVQLQNIENSFDRDTYITKLLYFRTKSMDQAANELFRDKEAYEILAESEIDLENYRSLISKALAKDSKVFVFQYPSQVEWPVLRAIAPFEGRVGFISLSHLFEEKLNQASVLNLFEDDFLHVTPLGAEILADGISERILSENPEMNQKW